MKRLDLTRWNRAGLTRFRYIDGNAATYLETLRLALINRFADQWGDLKVNVPAGESEQERLERLRNQYFAERKDLAWEIVRTLARSLHVLEEYADAYMNEQFLRTATQWENIRRLVEILDYHPAPPASASTTLVLLAKAGERGLISKGLQVKNSPDDGSAPVVFETMEDIELDVDLNRLHLKDWNVSQEPLNFQISKTHMNEFSVEFPIDSSAVTLSQGERGVLVIGRPDTSTDGIAVQISCIQDTSLELMGTVPEHDTTQLSAKRGEARLLLKPDLIQSPRLMGDNTVQFDTGVNLAPHSVIGWTENNTWYVAKVDRVDNDRVSLSGGEAGHTVPPAGRSVYLLHSSKRQQVGSKEELLIPKETHRFDKTVWASNLSRVQSSKVIDQTIDTSGGDVALYAIVDSNADRVYYLSSELTRVGVVKQSSIRTLEFDGEPGDLATGAWVIAVNSSNQACARQIETIVINEKEFSLTFSGAPLLGSIKTIYSLFSEEWKPTDYNKNLTGVEGTVLPLQQIPSSLKTGRKLILSNDVLTIETVIAAIDPVASTITITTPLNSGEPHSSNFSSSTSFTYYDLIIHGNVVKAGHGEIKPEKILGNGDATKTNQEFLLKVDQVSFVADALHPSGVRADIVVTVDRQIWTQTPTLRDSEATDPHYTVRMTEEGYLKIQFGDGIYGRRLPTGINNVRILYRVGVGLPGNLPSGQLTKPVKPHNWIESILHPVPAGGGNELESIESLRDNAPASVLVLERAVSLTDFTHLAARHSQVWQAKAFRVPTPIGRHETVRVVVVPAGGGELGELKDSLEDYLEAHAIPGVKTEVAQFVPVYLDLVVEFRIKTSEFDPVEVQDRIQSDLIDAFSLQKSKLGKPLFISELYRVVELVPGVENSTCMIAPSTLLDQTQTPIAFRHVAVGADGSIKSIRPADEQIVYIEPKKSSIEFVVREFSL